MNLSTDQEKIVYSSLNQPIQILASAGSGKTRVLTERVRFILEKTRRDGVIALTFTNKAAEEMKTRLSDCEEAQDRVWIATIHSVAQRILEKYAHSIGLPADLHIYDRDKDRKELFIQSLLDAGVEIDEKSIQAYLDFFSKIKRELLTEEEHPDPNEQEDWRLFKNYQTSLISSGGIDYDDILVYAHQILLTHGWIANIYRATYKHICVDEAQDLNKAQYEFIKVFCGDVIKNVLMVGDPNQMIYGFNSSSKDFLCKYFVEDFIPTQFELKENFRSTKEVIRAANKIRPGSQIGIEFALSGKMVIKEFDSEEDEARWIISEIQHLLELRTHYEIEGEISLDNMVVIARNRFVFTKLEHELIESGIPFFLRKGERQLEPLTKFGKILDYCIRIKLNPKDWIDGKKLCQVLGEKNVPRWSQGVLSNLAGQVKAKNQENSEVYAQLILAIDELDVGAPNIPKLVKEFKTKLTALAENRNSISKENTEDLRLSLEELNEFNRAWTNFKSKGLGNSLASFRNALALGQISDNGIKKGLTLSTVHTMKGLERDIVFLIGMCDGVFPDYRATSKKDLDEERNNVFVAITRAKRWLYITYPKQRFMPWGSKKFQQKSRFISEIENN
ncbi:MAG: ATP-dependent helicase [Candidatus Cloacimonetes bacterium]|nr:ATP-dependent helicase [Candidatus Cloacimonadota bacterium]